jgi:lipopolysaccharide/colanic/teichoic acid biosynthesis glycosyltransferase
MCEDADQMREDLINRTGADPRRPKWENDPRITRVGKWLRRTSLDELPQLLNVLRGEMSIVGPRPPTPAEVLHYEPWHRQRLNTLPGMTSLWQVSGRSKVPFEEQCLMDIYYIENWSIGLDIQIMLRTIPNVLIGTGAY